MTEVYLRVCCRRLQSIVVSAKALLDFEMLFFCAVTILRAKFAKSPFF